MLKMKTSREFFSKVTLLLLYCTSHKFTHVCSPGFKTVWHHAVQLEVNGRREEGESFLLNNLFHVSIILIHPLTWILSSCAELVVGPLVVCLYYLTSTFLPPTFFWRSTSQSAVYICIFRPGRTEIINRTIMVLLFAQARMGVHECVSHKLIDPFQVLFDKVANGINNNLK